MEVDGGGLIVIGENFNATRKIMATNPRVTEEDGVIGIAYTDLDGTSRLLDCTDIMPEDPAERETFQIPHIAQAMQKKDMNYIAWVIKNQERHGAHIIDLCADEMSSRSEERFEWIRWLVKAAQKITDTIVSIDSSDSRTIYAGLEVHDSSKSRPAINSFNLEPGRQELVGLAKERNALLFANASGSDRMPKDAQERVEFLTKCMDMMDASSIPMEDRFIDPLVFPIGVDSDFGIHFLDAVRELRARYPKVHIFGGHSNISFGMPRRNLLNRTWTEMAMLAGCDTVMVDPLTNSPEELNAFYLASRTLGGQDNNARQYLRYVRGQQ